MRYRPIYSEQEDRLNCNHALSKQIAYVRAIGANCHFAEKKSSSTNRICVQPLNCFSLLFCSNIMQWMKEEESCVG